uniref:BRCT domain-containing protein n=1 Tax=Panagrellus redivivus TaxID=6233 RepID=A0A7E4VBE9_PANRE
MESTVGFGIVLSLEDKVPEQEFPPATVYYRNQVLTAPGGHRDAVPGKWVNLLVREDLISIMDVMVEDLVITRVFSPTDFEVETTFSIYDDQTVYDMFCGYARVVLEDQEYLSQRRGYVYGTARPDENWHLVFELKEPPDGCNVMNSLYDPNAVYDPNDYSDYSEDEMNGEEYPDEAVPCSSASDGHPTALQRPDYEDSYAYQAPVDDAAAFMFPEQRCYDNCKESVISSLSSMSIDQTSRQSGSPVDETAVCSAELAVFEGYKEERQLHPIIGLPYRKSAVSHPLPKLELEIPGDDDEYIAFERFNRKAMILMAEMSRQPNSEKYLRCRDPESAVPLVLPEEKEFEPSDSDGEAEKADSMGKPPSNAQTMELNGTSSGEREKRFTKKRSKAEDESDQYFRFRNGNAVPLTLPEEKEFEPSDSDGDKTIVSKETPSSKADANGAGSRQREMRFTKKRPPPEDESNDWQEQYDQQNRHAVHLTLPEEKKLDNSESNGVSEAVDSMKTPSSEPKLRFTKRRLQPNVEATCSPPRNDDWYAEAWTANRSSNGYGMPQKGDPKPYGASGSYSKKPKHVNPYDLYDAMVARNSSTTNSTSSQHSGGIRNLPKPLRFTQRRPEQTVEPAYGEPVSKRCYGQPVPAHSNVKSSSTAAYEEQLPRNPATMEVPKPPRTLPSDSSNPLQSSNPLAAVRPPKVKRYVISQPGELKSAPRRKFVIVHPPTSTSPPAQQDAPSPSASHDTEPSPSPYQKTRSRSSFIGDHGWL